MFQLLQNNLFALSCHRGSPSYDITIKPQNKFHKIPDSIDISTLDGTYSSYDPSQRDNMASEFTELMTPGFVSHSTCLQRPLFSLSPSSLVPPNHEHAFTCYSVFARDDLASAENTSVSPMTYLSQIFFRSSSRSISFEPIPLEVKEKDVMILKDRISRYKTCIVLILFNNFNFNIRTNTDLNTLWKKSKVADDAENSRLVHRLMRAGLV